MTSKVYIVSNMAMGGVESFSHSLALNLCLQGYQASLLDLNFVKPGTDRYLDKESLSKIKKHVPVISRESFFNNFTRISKDDLIIIPMYAHKIMVEFFDQIKETNNLPIIFGYLHGMGAYYYDSFKEFLPLLSKLISVTEIGKNELNRIFPTRMDDAVFLQCPSSINLLPNEQKRSMQNGKLNVIFVGRMVDKVKGIFRLPEIMVGLEDKKVLSKFRIIGTGPDLQELAKRITELNLEFIEVEYILDAKTPEAVKKHYLKSDILLLLSNHEGAPLVIFEALACGVIPFSYDVGSVSSTINSPDIGRVYPIGEITKVFQDLNDLSLDKNKIERMSLNGINRNSELENDFGSYILKLMKYYKESKSIDVIQAIVKVNDNRKIKYSKPNFWIKDIIPADIIGKHHISYYIRMLKVQLKEKEKELTKYKLITSIEDFDNVNLAKIWIKSLVKKLKRKWNKIFP